MIGMGAFCIGCGAKNATGKETGLQLLNRYPNGCHYCSRAMGVGPNSGEVTRANLKVMIKDKGHAFVDMEGNPLKPFSGGKK